MSWTDKAGGGVLAGAAACFNVIMLECCEVVPRPHYLAHPKERGRWSGSAARMAILAKAAGICGANSWVGLRGSCCAIS